MEIGRISIRYAKALFDYACEQKAEDTVYEELDTMSNAFLVNPELGKLLGNPVMTDEQKEKVLAAAAGKNVSETTRNFLRFAVRKKKETFMPFIAMSYKTLYCKEKKIVFAELTTAGDVPSGVEEKILSVVQKAYSGETIKLVSRKNPDLIGGFVLNIDHAKLDGSISGELKMMKRKMGIA